MGYRKNPISREELRELAKKRMQGLGANVTATLSLPELQKLFEELEIHQIELELQNEYLNSTRALLEVALNQSSELYDFSPVGSVLLDRLGSITKLNLSGANLLGGERARLMGSRLGLYVADADVPVFNNMLSLAASTGDSQGCEITLKKNGLPSSVVQIRIAPLPEALGWQLSLVDMTERRRAEENLRTSEERWKLALEATGDGVWDWNVSTGSVVFSKRFAELFDYSENEYGAHITDWSSRIHPEDKAQVMSIIQACLTGQTDSIFSEHRGQCRDGYWKWVLCRGAVVSRTAEGKPLRVIGTYTDIMKSKQTEEALLVAARFQQAVFDSLAAHIAVLDSHGSIIQTNAAWRKYANDNGFGITSEFMTGNYLHVLDHLTGHDSATVQAATLGIASVGSGELAYFQLSQPFFTASDKHWFSMKITPVHDAQERLVVSHEDVTNLKAAELASLTLANTDALTGALSRRNFLNLAEQELARSTRYAMPLMLLMLDLDHFKCINDQHGHAAGDAVLQGFVQTVTGVLRESDLIGRLGGEEFAVLLPNTSLEGGQALAQRIIESVRNSPVSVGCKNIPYTVSIGAGCLSGETTFAVLLGEADAALYRAKNGGRDRLEVGAVGVE